MADQTAMEIAEKGRSMLASSLRDVQHSYGRLTSNAWADGFLQAATAHLISTLGKEGAYESLLRHADGILAPVGATDGAP